MLLMHAQQVNSAALLSPGISKEVCIPDIMSADVVLCVQARRRAVIASRSRTGRPMLSTRQAGGAADVKFGKSVQPLTASPSFATGPALELS